jgi:hypothetical protein
VPLISIALWGYIACNNLATQCINCGGSDHSRWILMRLAKPSRSNEHDRLPLPSVMNKRCTSIFINIIFSNDFS